MAALGTISIETSESDRKNVLKLDASNEMHKYIVRDRFMMISAIGI